MCLDVYGDRGAMRFETVGQPGGGAHPVPGVNDHHDLHCEGHVRLQHCYAEVDAPIVDVDVLVPTGQQGVSHETKLPDPVDRPVTQNAPLLIDFSDGVLAVEFPDDVDGSGVAFFVEVDDGSCWDDVREETRLREPQTPNPEP